MNIQTKIKMYNYRKRKCFRNHNHPKKTYNYARKHNKKENNENQGTQTI
jgi:hypothetical protein